MRHPLFAFNSVDHTVAGRSAANRGLWGAGKSKVEKKPKLIARVRSNYFYPTAPGDRQSFIKTLMVIPINCAVDVVEMFEALLSLVDDSLRVSLPAMGDLYLRVGSKVMRGVAKVQQARLRVLAQDEDSGLRLEPSFRTVK